MNSTPIGPKCLDTACYGLEPQEGLYGRFGKQVELSDDQWNRPDNPVPLEDLIRLTARRFRMKQLHIQCLSERGPVPGTIWRLKSEEIAKDLPLGPLVVVLGKKGEVNRSGYFVVAELSEEVDQPEETGMVIAPEESGLSFPVTACMGNVDYVDHRKFKSPAGLLSPKAWQFLKESLMWVDDSI